MLTYALYGLAYFLGAIPFGLLFTKMAGKQDIRQIGSGNIGATNVLRSGSKGLALLTLLADLLKGVIPIVLARSFQLETQPQLIIGGLAVLGHIFPLWLKFKGGKGVATSLGVYIALCPLIGGLVIVTWALAAKIGRISSLSALLAFFMAPLYSIFLIGKTDLVLFTMGVYFIISWTHRENIKRILTGKESKF